MAGNEPAVQDRSEAAHGRHFEIIVNGRHKRVQERRISFEQVVALAFDPVPSGPGVSITVSFEHADQRPERGTLIEGRSVEIKNGTIFHVTATDQS
jgi:Multiubiquitin